MAQTIVVTGAAGFVGHHLLDLLHRSDPNNRILAWRRSSADDPKRPPRPLPDSDRIDWRTVNLLDRPSVERELKDTPPDQVYHCAGVANVGGSWSNNTPTLAGNLLGTEYLIAGLRTHATEARVLIPGSALVYRPSTSAIDESSPLGPVSPYGLSKLAQEMLGMAAVKQDGLHVVITRSFTHVGPGQALFYAASSFAEQLARIEAGLCPPMLSVGNLEARRDLTDVRDTVLAYQLLMANGVAGAPYNVCSGTAHPIQAVLDGLLAQTTVDVTVREDPARTRPSDNPLLLGAAGRLSRQTGWHPTIPFERTLTDILNYWRDAVAATRG